MRIEAVSADSLFDEPIAIRLAGFPSMRAVTLRSTAVDGIGRKWAARATFLTDDKGAVDLSIEAPRSGTYAVADPMGLLWSMEIDRSITERTGFVVSNLDPLVVRLTAEIDGRETASAELRRRFSKPDIVREEVRSEGLVASFFHSNEGPRPGVLVVGGSGGGLSEDQPALLANHGYAVMSLAYFAMPGLPQGLVDIPLEYFERAFEWLRRNPNISSDKLAVIGTSRGGELALLLGATFRHIGAVVAYVPSGIVWPGLGAGDNPAPASWTWRGQPIPFINSAPPDPNLWSKVPVSMTPWFLESMKNRESAERAAIPVEKTGGPILMFSGTDDQMWPSLNLADFAVQRLIDRGFPHPYEHVSYAGAGHMIRFPYTPVVTETFHPIVKAPMALGGSPHANHVANLDSWHRCVSFLKKFLG